RHLEGSRMTVQNFVNLPRIDVVSAGNNQFLLAVNDEQIAFIIEVPDITRVNPAVANRLRRLLRAIAITLDHLGPAHTDLTAFVRRHASRPSFEIDDLNLRFRWRNADRKDLALSGYRIVRVRGALGHSDALVNRAACDFLPVRQQV